ncbi:MAG: response regulator [Rhodocyclaceae bacterium]|nr:response regulator [Rhodocyclaceae bacterium]
MAANSYSFAFVGNCPQAGPDLGIALERAGHQVSHYADGQAALAAPAGRRPDAVLLDAAPADGDRSAVLADLRRCPRLHDALFIGLANAAAPDAPHPGFDHLLSAAEPLATLLELVKQHASKRGYVPERTLLVEDHPDLALATAMLLRREGMVVDIAHSAAQAMEMAARHAPDLMLCDLNLPDMSGLQLVHSLRTAAPAHTMRVVIVSAYSEADLQIYRLASQDLDIDAFMSKPITSDTIRKTLAGLGARHRRKSRPSTTTTR